MPYNTSGRETDTPSWTFDSNHKKRNDEEFIKIKPSEFASRIEIFLLQQGFSAVTEDKALRTSMFGGRRYTFQFHGEYPIREMGMIVVLYLYVEIEPAANPCPYSNDVSMDTTMELAVYFGFPAPGVTFDKYIANKALQKIVEYWPTFSKAFNYQFCSFPTIKIKNDYYKRFPQIISLQSYFQYQADSYTFKGSNAIQMQFQNIQTLIHRLLNESKEFKNELVKIKNGVCWKIK